MSPGNKYPWYNEVPAKEFMQQGDFVVNCPVLLPKSKPSEKNPDEVEAEQVDCNVIILTQSCDLAARKIDIVLVCPFYTLDEYSKVDVEMQSAEKKEALRRGFIYYLHLLDHCPLGGFNSYLVVEFKNVYGVPFSFLEKHISGNGNRIRLLPPYREHLSQAFARYFMRVGLPLDIKKFKK